MTDGASRQTTYQYDALDRLTQADHPAMPAPLDSLPDVENFSYDGVGNRTMTGYAHDANHRVRESPGHTYDYDDDGNLLLEDPNTPDQRAMSWNADGELSGTLTSSGSSSYLHDPFRRRVRSTTGIDTSWELWLGESALATYSTAGARVRIYAYAESIAPSRVLVGPSLSSGDRLFGHSDRIGLIRTITAQPSSSVVWRAAYGAFGVAEIDEDADSNSSTVSIPNSFPGHLNEPALSLSYGGSRYYSPELGRYLSPDRLGLSAGLNTYSYAFANPAGYIDASGEAPSDWAATADSAIEAAKVAAQTGEPGNWDPSYWMWDATIETLADVAHGFADSLRFGEGIAQAVQPCGDGWDVAIGVATDVARGSALADVIAGTALAGLRPRPAAVAESAGKTPHQPAAGRGSNKLRPHPAAEGAPHTTFRRNPQTGRIEHYQTFDPEGTAGGNKRFRGTGKDHGGVHTPLVVEPRPGHPGGTPNRARPARPGELPNGF